MTEAIDPTHIQPLDDSGSDTAARFRYQAEVMFPFCLVCGLGGEIEAVIAEHLEDIAIRLPASWRFIQVKSRNPEQSLWTLAMLLADGGALRALYRTHVQTLGVPASLELLLEGAINRRNLIAHLLRDGDRKHLQLLKAVAEGLEVGLTDAETFLERVTLLPAPQPRSAIRSENLRLLHEHNPDLDHKTIRNIYDLALAEIERAIRAESLGLEWPKYVVSTTEVPEPYGKTLAAKTLHRGVLKPMFKALTLPPTPLLVRVSELNSGVLSVLERKLMVGGADADLIDAARALRANSQIKILQAKAQGKANFDELVEDLHLRLETFAKSRKTLHSQKNYPAVHIWNDLFERLCQSPDSFDRHNLVSTDGFLLMGQLCELAEVCRFDFGVKR
jgi:Cap4 dsDNA endonuclease